MSTEQPSRPSNIVHIESVPAVEGPNKGQYRSQSRRIGRLAGGKQLGCSHYELPPGATAFPYHWHGANEEAIVILEGEGLLKQGGEHHPVRAGDYIAFPIGPAFAHQLTNNGTVPLKYLCFATTHGTEVCGYPDSKKLATFVVVDGQLVSRQVTLTEEQHDYFERDPLAE